MNGLENSIKYAIMGVDSLGDGEKFLFELFNQHGIQRGYPT